ncbi:MAG TPA: hypothetical protein VJ461_01810 [Candidatus Nanoarchaeia archaeon]|nr:hypothetical protein [Candidatus Nanoarchaeia archaeon]
MEPLQLREKEIFTTLRKIKGVKFVVIGGYAVNAYTLPRFSVDCDIVLKATTDLQKLEKKLAELGYSRLGRNVADTPYHGEFVRFEKEISIGFKVSLDFLIKNVYDRGTSAVFSAEWVFHNSGKRRLKGKTVRDELMVDVIKPDALFVMKMVSCRAADIRDLFMLVAGIKDKLWIKQEVSERCDFDGQLSRIRQKIVSRQFKDGLQGVFGFIDKRLFDKHKNLIFKLGE